jgi:hypothetical protein
MSDQPVRNPENANPQHDEWEMNLRATASAFQYPPTPDISGAVRKRIARRSRPSSSRRGLLWAAIILLVSLCALLAIPQVRATVLEFLRIGAVHFFVNEPPTPATTATPLRSVLDLAGETTLATAQSQVTFPIRLPGYPADLGRPDHVFLQDLGGSVVVLVWMDRVQPDKVRLSLHQIDKDVYAGKTPSRNFEQTTVNGQPAVWTEGPYMLLFMVDGRPTNDFRRLITGHVLVWVESTITYRLETDLPLDEAIRIAESLR